MAATSTLSLNVLLADRGVFPHRSSGGLAPSFTIGMLQTMAPTIAGFGCPEAQGQRYQIANHAVLYSVIGTAFGGDGSTDFLLPDLVKRSAVGGPALAIRRPTRWPRPG
jgi:hypothetical protein